MVKTNANPVLLSTAGSSRHTGASLKIKNSFIRPDIIFIFIFFCSTEDFCSVLSFIIDDYYFHANVVRSRAERVISFK